MRGVCRVAAPGAPAGAAESRRRQSRFRFGASPPRAPGVAPSGAHGRSRGRPPAGADGIPRPRRGRLSRFLWRLPGSGAASLPSSSTIAAQEAPSFCSRSGTPCEKMVCRDTVTETSWPAPRNDPQSSPVLTSVMVLVQVPPDRISASVPVAVNVVTPAAAACQTV